MEEVIENKENPNFKKRALKNILIVLIANFVSVLSGILVGFIIPKIMGVSEYGYYKTFTLYSSYLGLLHFGFVDGIYLKYAGKNYDDLDKSKFRLYTRFLFSMELTITILVSLISLFFLGTNYFLIVLFVGLNILAANMSSYYEFITQVTMRFSRSSIRTILRCTLNVISVGVLYLLYRFNDVVIYNYIYVIITLSINYLLALWYAITYRDITFGKSSKLLEEKDSIISFFKCGIPLLLSNIIAMIIFVVDQQFVNIAFDNDTYAIYAFAYNMISLITIATNAVSTVMYPTLKTLNQNTIKQMYSKLNSCLLMVVAFCLIIYYPLVVIVNGFLPQYADSLPIFLIILPGVLISSNISVIKYNCYKAFDKVNNYFIKSIIILITAIVADLIVYFIFKDTKSISIVSVVVLFIWYIITELYFIRTFHVSWVKNLVYMLLIIASFYGISFIPNIYLAGGVYLATFIVLSFILFKTYIIEVFSSIKNKLKRRSA